MFKTRRLTIQTATILLIIGFAPTLIFGRAIPREIVLKMAPGMQPGQALQNRPARLLDSIPLFRTFLVETTNADSTEAMLNDLSNNASVTAAEPNYEVSLPENYQMSISFPDDNAPPLLEGVEPSSFYDQPATYAIGVDEAQTLSTGNGITVAVIDNGVDFAHPLLAPRLLTTGYDFIDDDDNPGYEEGAVASHGTFVSGLIVRVAPDAKVLPIRAFDGDGFGTSFAIAKSIYYAVERGADIVNMSFGMFDSSMIIANACKTASQSGLSLVAACGNNSTSQPTYPAAYKNVIAVSGIGPDDVHADFSNFGEYIDVCAPAVDLYSCLAGDDYDWGTWSGTSFAAPLVSAACALTLELNPSLNAPAMEYHIRESATVDLQWGTVVPPDVYYGYGRIDVAKAVFTANDPSLTSIYGDMNGSGNVDAADVVHLAAQIRGQKPVANPRANPDLNCDGTVGMEDVEFLINYIYHNGPTPDACH